jgi:hypothetical protein
MCAAIWEPHLRGTHVKLQLALVAAAAGVLRRDFGQDVKAQLTLSSVPQPQLQLELFEAQCVRAAATAQPRGLDQETAPKAAAAQTTAGWGSSLTQVFNLAIVAGGGRGASEASTLSQALQGQLLVEPTPDRAQWVADAVLAWQGACGNSNTGAGMYQACISMPQRLIMRQSEPNWTGVSLGYHACQIWAACRHLLFLLLAFCWYTFWPFPLFILCITLN